MLEASDLRAGYGEAKVLAGIDVTVSAGRITAVIGSNGAGKTTLMRVLAGLVRPTGGRILLEDEDITALPANARVDRGMALVPEGRLVFPDFTVEETLKIGAYIGRARGGWRARADEMYDLFPRLAERRRTRAGSLSGGEQQMLAIARALMSAPRVLCLDEPSLGLAPAMAELMFHTVRELRARGITVLIVEQDVHSTLEAADYAYVLENGAIATQGPGAELLESPLIKESYLGL